MRRMGAKGCRGLAETRGSAGAVQLIWGRDAVAVSTERVDNGGFTGLSMDKFRRGA